MDTTELTETTAMSHKKIDSVDQDDTTPGTTPVPQMSKANPQRRTLLIILVVIFIQIALIALAVYISSLIFGKDSNNNSSDCGSDKAPKNLIIFIGDGMGQTYNTAYRLWKNKTSTLLDQTFKGRYATRSSTSDVITGSAAGATCFACGVRTHNGYIGLDKHGNPVGNILSAAKRQGKGTGIIATKSVTDATPASFSAHALSREWENLIAKQQVTTQIDGNPMLDILMGGGLEYFQEIGFLNDSTIWHDKYGWNTVLQNGSKVDLTKYEELTSDDLPLLALFAEDDMPFYLDRINPEEGDTEYPTLMEMVPKAIDLLNSKYDEDGFVLVIEASKLDVCGHSNDIVCLLWEMEEVMQTLELIFDFAGEDNDTLVVVLSDHETGGLSLGREASGNADAWAFHMDKGGQTYKGGKISENWGSLKYDYTIDPPLSLQSSIINYGPYQWIPNGIESCKHTAIYLVGSYNDNITLFYESLEDNYLGSNEAVLSDLEKEFVNITMLTTTYYGKSNALTMLMNLRTLTGWSSHSHTGSDVAVHAYGPGEDEFYGSFDNFEIGLLMMELLGLEDEMEKETQYLQDEFVNGDLILCDTSTFYGLYVEWNNSVPFPEGNLLYPQNCVDQWDD